MSCGKKSILIEANGDVFPCQMFRSKEYLFCNIKEIESLKDKLKASFFFGSLAYQEFMKYHPQMSEKCKLCPVNIFCWSCPYYLMIAHNDNNRFLEHCKLQKKKLMKSVWGVSYEEYNNMANESVQF